MKKAHIYRMSTGVQGTLGFLQLQDGWGCRTLELPWRDNAVNISCIPEGEYTCRVVQSGKYGSVYHVQDVPGRTGILIHPGNLAGSESDGWITHSHGCILLGRQAGVLGGQRAVLFSRPAVATLMRRMEGKPFVLNVQDVVEHRTNRLQ